MNRGRLESTFYEDLREKLRSNVDADLIQENYIVPGVSNADNYPVDYLIEGGALPVYLFGVPNKDKARLVTIILQHLIAWRVDFNSMIVFQNASDVPSRDLNHLMNAVNDMLASLDASVMWLQEEGRATVATDKEEGVLAPLQAASITYRIAYGTRQGQKLLTLQSQVAPSPAEKKRCVSLHGFSLHANVRCAAKARQPLERLCRCITRPALANDAVEKPNSEPRLET